MTKRLSPTQQAVLIKAHTIEGSTHSGARLGDQSRYVRRESLHALAREGLVTLKVIPAKPREGRSCWGQFGTGRTVWEGADLVAVLTPAGRALAEALTGRSFTECSVIGCDDVRPSEQAETRCAYHVYQEASRS